MTVKTGVDLAENELENEVLSGDQGLEKEPENLANEGTEEEGEGDAPAKLVDSTQRRIKKLLKDRRLAEELAAENARIAQELKEENETLKKTATAGTRLAVDKTEGALKGQIDSLKSQIKAARNAGDVDAQGELEDKLLEARFELRDLERVKASIPEDQEDRTERQPQRAQAPQQQVTEELRDWMDSNSSWFNPTNPSDAQQQKMRYAVDLDKELSADGFEFGTKEYLDEMDKRLGENFPKMFPDKVKAQGKMTGDLAVGGRSSGVAGQQVAVKKNMKLSPREQEMARKLILNSGVLRRPVDIGNGKFERLEENEANAFRVYLYQREKANM